MDGISRNDFFFGGGTFTVAEDDSGKSKAGIFSHLVQSTKKIGIIYKSALFSDQRSRSSIRKQCLENEKTMKILYYVRNKLN
jgi:hypothetical protein